jgi:hypothetical protein
MLQLLVQADLFVEGVDPPVDPHAGEAVPLRPGEDLLVLPLAVARHRGQQEPLRAGRLGEDAVHDLLRRLGPDRSPAGRTVGLSHPGVEDAQVVVDLGDRAHRGARIAGGGLLLDGDRRREAADVVHLGLLLRAQELPGVRGEGLHVAPLPLGVEGVEGERGLARPGDAGEHHQPVARELHVHSLEVVLASTPDDDGVRSHAPTLLGVRRDCGGVTDQSYGRHGGRAPRPPSIACSNPVFMVARRGTLSASVLVGQSP